MERFSDTLADCRAAQPSEEFADAGAPVFRYSSLENFLAAADEAAAARARAESAQPTALPFAHRKRAAAA